MQLYCSAVSHKDHSHKILHEAAHTGKCWQIRSLPYSKSWTIYLEWRRCGQAFFPSIDEVWKKTLTHFISDCYFPSYLVSFCSFTMQEYTSNPWELPPLSFYRSQQQELDKEQHSICWGPEIWGPGPKKISVVCSSIIRCIHARFKMGISYPFIASIQI